MAGRARSSWTPSTAEPADPALAAGLDRVWERLAAAVADRKSPLRTPVVVTAGDDGPDGRVMVLRGVDRPTATLVFFTDARADKVAKIVAAPRLAVVAYDPAAKLQFRMGGTAIIERSGAAVESAWAGLPVQARRAYRTVSAPGTVAESPAVAGRLVGDGRVNFARIVVVIDAIEWLELAGSGDRRARYRRVEPTWRGDWLTP